MKKLWKLLVVCSVLLAFSIAPAFGAKDDAPKPGPDEGTGNKVLEAATPNLSFPVIMTDIIQMFYQQTWVDEDGEYNTDGVYDEGEKWILLLDETTGLPIPIVVDEVIDDTYAGSYAGNDEEEYCYYTLGEDGCAVDINSWGEDENGDEIIIEGEDGVVDDADLTCEPMEEWLLSMTPWRDQPVYIDAATDAMWDPNLIWDVAYIDGTDLGGENSWQADWYWTGDMDGDSMSIDPVWGDNDADSTTWDPFDPSLNADSIIYIDFIDWGNPLENTVAPIVGQRFPVEVALYEKFADVIGPALEVEDTTMTAYKMACLEYPSSKLEIFGTSVNPDPDTGDETFGSAFATVLTNRFYAEVWNPDGSITKIPIEPGIGPSGKMNFASAGGGWIPYMAGWHRIWLHFNDPQISLSGAEVNNDEHYIMSTGCKVQDLNKNKQELVGIVGDSTYIDVQVMKPNGGKKTTTTDATVVKTSGKKKK